MKKSEKENIDIKKTVCGKTTANVQSPTEFTVETDFKGHSFFRRKRMCQKYLSLCF